MAHADRTSAERGSPSVTAKRCSARSSYSKPLSMSRNAPESMRSVNSTRWVTTSCASSRRRGGGSPYLGGQGWRRLGRREGPEVRVLWAAPAHGQIGVRAGAGEDTEGNILGRWPCPGEVGRGQGQPPPMASLDGMPRELEGQLDRVPMARHQGRRLVVTLVVR